MPRLIFIPQYPAKLRYQEWWYTEIPKQFRNLGWDVLVVDGNKDTDDRDESLFSPITKSIKFELEQLKQFTDLKVYPDDVIFLADISFPGFFANSFVYKKTDNIYAFCHATAKNRYDLFESFRDVKYTIEKSQANLFKTIFVGSQYHKDKLGWQNTKVVYLPMPPFSGKELEKEYDVVSVSRPTKQKVDLELEKFLENELDIKIVRPTNLNSWDDYYEFLAKSKVLFISAVEDTFGYQIIDAILNKCIPIVRDCCAYKEIISEKYMYSSKTDAADLVYDALHYFDLVPEILIKDEMKHWYENISDIMKSNLQRSFGVTVLL